MSIANQVGHRQPQSKHKCPAVLSKKDPYFNGKNIARSCKYSTAAQYTAKKGNDKNNTHESGIE